MARILCTLSCVIFSSSFVSAGDLPSPAKPGNYAITFASGGYDREVHVLIPAGYDSTKPPPLVIGLHGAGGSGEQFLNRDGWAELADKEGFIVISPTGLPARPNASADFLTNPHVWNSGQLIALSVRAKIDDVAFIKELLDNLKERVPYDPARVFVTGHSNGAGMTFRLAEEMSERIAAIATVAGQIVSADPKPKRPIPTLYILGTEDPLTPLNGGESVLPWGKRQTKPVAEYLAKWAKAIGCETEPIQVSNEGGLKTVEYRPKTDGPKLTAIYIEGQGHAWPGGKEPLSGSAHDGSRS